MNLRILAIVVAVSVIAFSYVPAFSQIAPEYFYDSIAVNNLKTFIGNDGLAGHNPYTFEGGMEFPKHSGNVTMFTEGFVLIGHVNSQLRSCGSWYWQSLQRGNILSPYSAADTNDAKYHVYKIKKMTAQEYQQLTVEEQQRLRSDFVNWPVESSGGFIDRNSDGMYNPDFNAWLQNQGSSDQPIFEGDEMLWYVANDLNEKKLARLFNSPPTSIEYQVSVWGYNDTPLLSNTLFTRYRMIHKGIHDVKDAYFGKFCDPDIGDSMDDFLGYDSTFFAAYTYNRQEIDSYYGIPPASAHVLVQGPVIPATGIREPATFMGKYREAYENIDVAGYTFYIWNTEEYRSPALGTTFGANMVYNNSRGKRWNGEPYLDPISGDSTTYPISGNPLTGDGWLDRDIWETRDRTYYFASGPFDFAPGDTQEVIYAYTVAQGVDRLNSLELVLQNASQLRSIFRERHVTSTTAPETPSSFALGQNYPNPVSDGRTVIPIELPQGRSSILRVYDILGKLVYEQAVSGRSSISLDMKSLSIPPGMYKYSLISASRTATRTMMVIQ